MRVIWHCLTNKDPCFGWHSGRQLSARTFWKFRSHYCRTMFGSKGGLPTSRRWARTWSLILLESWKIKDVENINLASCPESQKTPSKQEADMWDGWGLNCNWTLKTRWTDDAESTSCSPFWDVKATFPNTPRGAQGSDMLTLVSFCAFWWQFYLGVTWTKVFWISGGRKCVRLLSWCWQQATELQSAACCCVSGIQGIQRNSHMMLQNDGWESQSWLDCEMWVNENSFQVGTMEQKDRIVWNSKGRRGACWCWIIFPEEQCTSHLRLRCSVWL